MTDERLNELLREWGSARSKASSKYNDRATRLAKILDLISEASRVGGLARPQTIRWASGRALQDQRRSPGRRMLGQPSVVF
jgi:hypothetical protein